MMSADIVSSLPLELAQKIFEYLDAKDVSRCQAVSKSWRKTSNTDRIWRKLTEKHFQSITFKKSMGRETNEGDGKLCRWAALFISYHKELCDNWQFNRFETARCTISGMFSDCMKVQGQVAVVAYDIGVLQVHRFPSLVVCQRILIRIPGLEKLTIQIEGDMFTLTKSNITLIYQRSSKESEFMFREAFAVNAAITSTREDRGLESWLEERQEKGVLWESVCLLSGCVWMTRKSGRGGGESVVWDSRVSTATRLGGAFLGDPVVVGQSSHSVSILTRPSTLDLFNPHGQLIQRLELCSEMGFDRGWKGTWHRGGLFVRASPCFGAIQLSAWEAPPGTPPPPPLWSVLHPTASEFPKTLPVIVNLTLILERFVYCEYSSKKDSGCALFSARSGALLRKERVVFGQFKYADHRGILRSKVNFKGTHLVVNWFDHFSPNEESIPTLSI